MLQRIRGILRWRIPLSLLRISKVCSVLSAKSFSSAGLHNLFRTFLSKIRSLVIISRHARVAKLVDAPDLGSGGSSMGVRVPSRAPRKSKTLRLGEVFYLQLPIWKRTLNSKFSLVRFLFHLSIFLFLFPSVRNGINYRC